MSAVGNLKTAKANAAWEVAVAKKKRHSRVEIATKLAKAK